MKTNVTILLLILMLIPISTFSATDNSHKSNDDPCENIPKGHDSEMWKKYHSCP